MKQMRELMGMPVAVEIVDAPTEFSFEATFAYLEHVDATFSTYKVDSEISRLNAGLSQKHWSEEMKTVLALCEQTKQATNGYFEIRQRGRLDPSGLVKGWAVYNAAQLLWDQGHRHFYIEAGGDIEARGHNSADRPWRVGIRNPFNKTEIIKALAVSNQGVATSGTYVRGQHVYNPHSTEPLPLMSLTVIGPNVYEADRFATAAFAMGLKGIGFLELREGLEGYVIDRHGIATMTSGFERYVVT